MVAHVASPGASAAEAAAPVHSTACFWPVGGAGADAVSVRLHRVHPQWILTGSAAWSDSVDLLLQQRAYGRSRCRVDRKEQGTTRQCRPSDATCQVQQA